MKKMCPFFHENENVLFFLLGDAALFCTAWLDFNIGLNDGFSLIHSVRSNRSQVF